MRVRGWYLPGCNWLSLRVCGVRSPGRPGPSADSFTARAEQGLEAEAEAPWVSW